MRLHCSNFALEMTKRIYLSLLRLLTVVVVVALWSCSSTKHVPQGRYLVDNVDINVVDNSDVKSDELVNYLRQTSNHRVLGFLKLQLATYNLSGRDTTKWFNRWVRRLGQPPVIYDQNLTDASSYQLRQALVNRGYMDAVVEVDTVKRDKKKKINVSYNIYTGKPHFVRSVAYEIADTAVAQIVLRDTARLTIKAGDLLDRNALEAERSRMAEQLRNHGYYAFNKEYITFVADTAVGSKSVDLTLVVRQPKSIAGISSTIKPSHVTYNIRDVYFVTDYNPGANYGDYDFSEKDTTVYNGLRILYGKDHYIKPKVLEECCFIRPGSQYRATDIDRTYEALGRLGILKYVNINMRELGEIDGEMWLDAYVSLTRGKKQGVALELEGTNSEGDLGFGVGVTYQHRNLAHGAEALTAKMRMSYESLSGDFSGLINNRYTEFSGEVGLTLPKFQAPFLSKNFKKRVRATTEFATSFNYQERPEYTRIIAGTSWRYLWNNRQNTLRHRFELLDINYVYLPKSTIDFINQVAPTNPLLRYSYEDHFIMRMGYSLYRTNKRTVSATSLQCYVWQPSVYTLRSSIEIAGNALYGLSSLLGDERSGGAYKLFGIQYAQYVKAEVDYTYTRNFNDRNTLAFHVGAGVGVPYGNSSMMPFEKRFYSGGANSVRGWGVRTLGPGSYNSQNSVTNFINQCGDIRFDMSLEYRAKLFWLVEGALFVDAGNIWTIHNYENQPGGMFKFDRFYKEIAAAYGIGLRLDFTYFLIRLDMGMKAYNPAENQERWPLAHPNFGRDATFHFSVGYPF